MDTKALLAPPSFQIGVAAGRVKNSSAVHGSISDFRQRCSSGWMKRRHPVVRSWQVLLHSGNGCISGAQKPPPLREPEHNRNKGYNMGIDMGSCRWPPWLKPCELPEPGRLPESPSPAPNWTFRERNKTFVVKRCIGWKKRPLPARIGKASQTLGASRCCKMCFTSTTLPYHRIMRYCFEGSTIHMSTVWLDACWCVYDMLLLCYTI